MEMAHGYLMDQALHCRDSCRRMLDWFLHLLPWAVSGSLADSAECSGEGAAHRAMMDLKDRR